MKSRVKIALVTIAALVIVLLGVYVLNYRLDKSYSIDGGIVGIQEFVDENDNPTKVSFVLEDINIVTLNSMTSNKYRIYSDDVSLSYSNSQSNEPLEVEDGLVTLTENGVKITANNISKGGRYDIVIEPVENKYGFTNDFKKAVIEIDYSDKLNAFVKEVIGKDNTSVEVDDKAILLYTEENNTVKLRANADVDLEYYFSVSELSDSQLSQTTFRTYDKNNYLAIETNGYLYAKAKYKTNGYSKINKLHITNIDKLKPHVNVTSITLNADNQSATVTYTFDDADETPEYGKSGIKSRAFTITPRATDDKYTDVTTETEASNVVDENGTYYIHVKDKAGNVVTEEVVVNIIPEQPADYVLIVLDSPVNQLNGMLFKSFNEMNNKIHEYDLDADDKVTAQALKNIRNQSGTFDDVNVELDLNGYTVSSNKSNKIFTVESGATLTLVDNKYAISDYISSTTWNGIEYSSFENGEAYGSVVSTSEDAIIVNNGATLTLGKDNSTDLKNIEYPDHNSPYIQGSNKGIVNNGTLNYYDGVIVGDVSLGGTVQDSPYLYDPAVIFNNELQKQYMTLERVTNIEALIGKTRYTLLEQAIEAANNTVGTVNDKIEIDVVADLTKTATVVVNNDKNIYIDMNGYDFTSTNASYVIENKGKLELGSSQDGAVVYSASESVIYNRDGAYLNISGGRISCTKSYVSTIKNETGAELLVSGGSVELNYENSSAAYAAIENIGGKVTITGGEVKGKGTLIYNDDTSITQRPNDHLEEFDLDLSTVQSNNVHFPLQYDAETGTVVSTNMENAYTESDGYFEIDLTGYSKSDLFDVISTVSYNNNYSNLFAYAGIRDNTNSLTSTNDYDYIPYESNRNNYTEKDISYLVDQYSYLQGGKKYYVHFGYKLNKAYVNQLVIHNIKIARMNVHRGEFHIDGGELINQAGRADRKRSIQNLSYGDKGYITGGTISDIVYNSSGTINMSGGTLTGKLINNGVFNMSGGYVEQMFNGAEGSTPATSANSFINISGGEVKNIKAKGTDDETTSSGVYFTGGTLLNEFNGVGKLGIKNATIKGTVKYTGYFDVVVDNATFISDTKSGTLYSLDFTIPGNPDNMYASTTTYPDRNGDVYVLNSTFTSTNEAESSSSPIYGAIKFNSHGSLLVENTTMNLKLSDTYEGNRGTSTTNSIYGIYSGNRNPNIIVINSNIKVESTNPTNLIAYGIYIGGKGNIRIGKKDGNYERASSVIEASNIAFYNNAAAVKFYDGMFKSTAPINTNIYDVESGYSVHKYNEDGYEITDLSNNTASNVLNVQKNAYYNSLSQAMGYVGANETLQIVVDNLYEAGLTVNSDVTCTIDLNGKHLYLGNLENNGNVTFDSTGEAGNVKITNYVNNGTTSFNKGNYLVAPNTEAGIINNGTMNISNSTFNHIIINADSYNKKDTTITNKGTLNIRDGARIVVNDSGTNIALNNKASGTTNVYGGDIYANTRNATNIVYNSGILNMSGGHVAKVYNTNEYVGPASHSLVTNSMVDCHTYAADGKIKNTCDDTYIPIDLTDKTGTFTLELELSKDYANTSTITTVTEELPTTSMTTEIQTISDYDRHIFTKELTGGKVYYLYTKGQSGYIVSIRYYNDFTNVELSKKGVFNLSGGEVKHIDNYSGIVNMSGGDVKDDGTNNYVVFNRVYGDFNMTGGTISSTRKSGIGVYTYYSSYSKLNGGEIKDVSTAVQCISCHKVDIDNTNINSVTTGVDVAGSTVNMTGGTINLESIYGGLNGIYLQNNSFLNMSGGTITVSSTERYGSNMYGIRAYGSYSTANANITGGTITGTGVDATKNIYAVYADGNNTFNVTLGTNDDTVSTTSPILTGTSYGLYKKAGEFNFYDGIIKGTTNHYSGGVSDRPVGYEIIEGTEDTYKTAYLDEVELIKNTDTNAVYSTLNKAIAACPVNEQCNLQVLYSFTVTGVIEIPANKSINLDINENKISTLLDNYIINRGSFKVTNGTMENTTGTHGEEIIDNFGTLEIGTGAIITTGNLDKAHALTNEYGATLNMTGGTIVTNSVSGSYGTYGHEHSNRNLDASGSAITNYGGTVNLTGGTIEDNANNAEHSTVRNSTKFIGEIIDETADIDLGNDFYDRIGYTLATHQYTIPIDLTEVSGDVTLEFMLYASNTSCDDVYYLINKTEAFPENINDSKEAYIKVAEQPEMSHVVNKTLAGGSKYYIHVKSEQYAYLTALKYYNDTVSKDYFVGTLNINGTSIVSDQPKARGVVVYGGVVNYTGGEIKSTTGTRGKGIVLILPSVLNVENVSIDSKQYGIYVYKYKSKVNVKNLTITALTPGGETYGIYMNSGESDVDGFNMDVTAETARLYGIYLKDNNPTTIKNADIDFSGGSYDSYGLYLDTNNAATISNSDININNTSNNISSAFGIYMNKGNILNIDSTSISVKSTINTKPVYGIGCNVDDSTSISMNNITIGSNDDSVSTTSPSIYGSNKGVNSKYGNFNYYDGVIKGEKAINVYPSDIPDDYNLVSTISSGEETIILSQVNVAENVDTYVSYHTLQAAIDACTDGTTCNIKLLRDLSLADTLTISNNKKVNIVFDDHVLYTTYNNGIVNNGELSLVSGSIKSDGIYGNQYSLTNNGTLNINNNFTMTTNKFKGSRLIKNNYSGIINMNGGELIDDLGSGGHVPIIYNEGGEVYLKGGTIKSEGAALGSLVRTVGAFEGVPNIYWYKYSDQVPSYTENAFQYTGSKNGFKYYIPIDLTNYSGDVEIDLLVDSKAETVNGEYRENKYNISTSTEEPAGWSSFGNIGSNAHKTISTSGGRVYYLHIYSNYGLALRDIKIKNNDHTYDFKHRGRVEVDGVTMIDGQFGVDVDGSDVYMKSGTITTSFDSNYSRSGIKTYQGSRVYATGGSITKRQNIIVYGPDSYLRVDGFTISGTEGIMVDGATVDIINLNYTYNNEEATSVYINPLDIRNSTLNIYNYNVDIKANNSGSTHGIGLTQLNDDSVIDDLNIKIDNAGSGSSVGIDITYGTVHLDKAYVEVKGSNSTALNIWGGSVTLGTDDGSYPTISDIVFKGDLYGGNVRSGGTLVFNDGKFVTTGSNESRKALTGSVITVPTGYRLVNEGNYCILGLESAVENTYESNGIYYSTIGEAINTIYQSDNKTGTIKIWNNVILGSTITIPTGTNITLALEGHTIEFNNVATGFTNNGTFTIIDGFGDEIAAQTQSYIVNDYGVAIQNNGVLTIGESSNPNHNSPIIRGRTPVGGTTPTIKSGKTEVSTRLLNIGSNGLFNLFQPSFSYKYNNLEVNRLPDTTPLAEMPGIRAVEDLTVWTNQDINVGMTSHNLAVLNIFTNKDESCTKTVKYTVEVYKNGVLDEFNSFVHEESKYCLGDNKVIVDKDYFDKVPTQFKDYYVTRLVLNDKDITTIPDNVDDGSTFRLYYGENKGEEIVIINPKTGRISYKKVFIIAVSAFIVLGLISFIYRLKIKKVTNN